MENFEVVYNNIIQPWITFSARLLRIITSGKLHKKLNIWKTIIVTNYCYIYLSTL